MGDSEGAEKKPSTTPEPPPNFEPEQIIQEDLTLEPPKLREEIKKQKREELEKLANPPPVISDFSKRVISGKQRDQYKPQFKPTDISPVKMEDDWKRATSGKGRPPIGGAPDD